MDITKLGIKEIQEGYSKKEFCVQDVTQSFLQKIEKENKEIGAYLSVFSDRALEDAKRVDKLMSEKKPLGQLAGIPCGLKDNILVEGQKCTAGSKVLENYIAPYNSHVTEKLQNEDSIILGKLNLDEFAIGSSGEYSGFYPVKNPKVPGCVPGGSSAGPAAAVAGDLCTFSLGSDTGGSIRQPAAFCGVVGLKTTYGRVSRHGLIAMASSLDQIGPFAKNVEDAEIIFDAIKGKDSMDATSCDDLEIKTP
ncbi:MAG: amidase, partial [Candidatus Gracilibacteria bacterium]|nr:amidase [Candidatus Gracilibacteria bacterium]